MGVQPRTEGLRGRSGSIPPAGGLDIDRRCRKHALRSASHRPQDRHLPRLRVSRVRISRSSVDTAGRAGQPAAQPGPARAAQGQRDPPAVSRPARWCGARNGWSGPGTARQKVALTAPRRFIAEETATCKRTKISPGPRARYRRAAAGNDCAPAPTAPRTPGKAPRAHPRGLDTHRFPGHEDTLDRQTGQVREQRTLRISRSHARMITKMMIKPPLTRRNQAHHGKWARAEKKSPRNVARSRSPLVAS